MRERNKFLLGFLFVLFFVLISCQGQIATTTSEPPGETSQEIAEATEGIVEKAEEISTSSPTLSDEGFSTELSPCKLTFDRVGQSVQTAGLVMFVDDTAPDGLYADLEGDNCRVGITIDTATFSSWNEEQQAAFNVGSEITVEGNLASYPLPNRPDEMQLVIEMKAVPVIGYAAEFSSRELDAPSDTLCLFPEDQVGQTVKAVGTILFVDHLAAAGLYAEMGSDDGCVYRLWLERTRWDTWSAEEQSNFVVDNQVEVEGVLTLVLREQNIDLSLPPRVIE